MMKILIKNILYSVASILFALAVANCAREYMPPPLQMPQYNWPPANVTIAEVKTRYADVNTVPLRISESWILRAIVTSSDISGNIYQQVYLEDPTGAINFGVAQFNIANTYAVGQEVFVNLEGLYVVRFGGELQIGYAETNANRISWENFQQKASRNGWPDAAKAIPTRISLDNLNENMVNMLVQIDSVYFVRGGENFFVTNNLTTNEPIRNAAGNTLDVRTSQFASFSADRLPVGYGTVTGLLGRFNGSWQLLLRSLDDVRNFDGKPPETGAPINPEVEVIFQETFGNGNYPAGNRPLINAFNDFDMKSPVSYSDPTGAADIRSLAGLQDGAHVWFPANRNAQLNITGINTQGRSQITLSYQLAANLFEVGTASNLNVIQVRINGATMEVPSVPVSSAADDNNVYRTVVLEGIPSVENLSIEFISAGTANTVGFRLDNIQIIAQSTSTSGGSPIILTPDN